VDAVRLCSGRSSGERFLEPDDFAVVHTLFQKVAHRLAQAGMDGVGSDLNHRLENETTFMKPWVGDRQLIARKDDVSEQQHVEIEDARLVTTGALTSAGCLHVQANLEELIGPSPEADLGDRIDEPDLL